MSRRSIIFEMTPARDPKQLKRGRKGEKGKRKGRDEGRWGIGSSWKAKVMTLLCVFDIGASRTLCFTRVELLRHSVLWGFIFATYTFTVFLTLELLKHCVLRGSSFSNTVFCGSKFSRPAVFHWFLRGRCHGCILFASKTCVRRPGAHPGDRPPSH